jgi:hypothetical protein
LKPGNVTYYDRLEGLVAAINYFGKRGSFFRISSVTHGMSQVDRHHVWLRAATRSWRS